MVKDTASAIIKGIMDNSNPLHDLRHSLAHLLAAAVLELWPETKRAIGPAIDNGFYYDFEFHRPSEASGEGGSQPITDKDLPKIEKTMRKILQTWQTFERSELDAEEARSLFASEPYKLELIDEFAADDKTLSVYTSGTYADLCRGGHVTSAREIKPEAFKLTHIAGAYWRGDEKRPMLTRIYGLAFATPEELTQHLTMLEEAKKRDHKKLGVELDLFTFSELVGAGLPLWTPRGTLLRTLLDDYVWQLRSAKGYQKVEIPHITKKELYETSGHWDKFKDELFKITTREGHFFAMKPMNCPHHTQIYARKQFSYRELPQRYANTTMVYRDEQSGELSGLSRARSITQDDAHVFCRVVDIKKEINAIWDIIQEFYKTFGFELTLRLSLHDPAHPENYLGDQKLWFEMEEVLRDIARGHNMPIQEAQGEAAFYGPKLDFTARDSMQRVWQVATIQLDMNQPERFDLTCINEKGEKERIIMIHAAIMGSIERFLSVYIEHVGGIFPVWLAPTQVALLPISEKHLEYAYTIQQMLLARDIRVELNDRNDTIGKKIREAEMQKIPYLLVMGDKEADSQTVAVRKRGKARLPDGQGDLGSMEVEPFLHQLAQEIQHKK